MVNFYSRLDEFLILEKEIEKSELLKFVYVLSAWKEISYDEDVVIDNESLIFDAFFNKKNKTINELSGIFAELSKVHKLFSLYKVNKQFKDHDLLWLNSFLENTGVLPKVNDAFFSSQLNKKGPSIVSNQIAELGVKLLYRNAPVDEVYIPFTNGFSYVPYLYGEIYADNISTQNALFTELINILEHKQINYKSTNALENPKFLDKDKLKEFKYVLSFPPFSVKQKLDIEKDKFNRFHFQKGSILDVAHFEHILAQTKKEAVVLMPVGFTYRSGGEEEFRKYLIENDYLKAIIQLPPSLHSSTSIETTFFVIDKRIRDDKRVMFINLKDESFIKREGRQLVLKSVDEIVIIYKDKKELENISTFITREEIINNNYSFAIDRYIIPEETKQIQKSLEKYELAKLEDIADIKKSQLFKDEEKGLEIYELSPSDFSKAGFTLECGKTKQIGSQENRLDTYKLEPYDVLISTKGTIGKVAIIGEIKSPMMASQAIQVIRLHGDNKKDNAIALYMFFKSKIGQTLLSSLVSGTAMPQVSTAEMRKIGIPIFTKDEEKKLFLNFNNEIEMYNKITYLEQEIQKQHNDFLKV